MKQEQVDRFQHWFMEYTSRFCGDDDYVNAHVRLKQEHTERTREEMRFLVERLALDEEQRRIADVVALFHDVGRFPQFAEHRTFNDTRSVDHCRLGVEVLAREGILATLRRQERQWIETAIEHHGRKSLPPGLRGQALLFAKLIRDADKLDIFHVVISNYRAYKADPGKFSYELELPDSPDCSGEVLDALMNGQLIDYRKLRTLNDMKLCQLGWVYDMNFGASLERLRHRRFIEQVVELLPQSDAVEQVRRKVMEYIESRLAPV